ncbi:MAG TPA: serine acetyltransferase [bacterium]|nr:serine acetyltransferase [bacterium]
MPDVKPPLDLSEVVHAICDTNDRLAKQLSRRNGHPLPSRDKLIEIVERLKAVLFPGYFGLSEMSADNVRFHIGALLDSIRRDLREQIKRGLCFACIESTGEKCPHCEQRALEYTDAFLARLSDIRHLLGTDVQAAYEGDPAATSPDETIFCYPGVQAITYHRLAHELHRLAVPLIPRIISEHAHSVTGIDIHPGATIGERFFIDHGTGVVIGETCVIGRNVRLYQGVTLGAKSFPLDDEGKPIKGVARHPIVEDDVIVYSGATILGRVTLGRGSVIGGNVWLTESVPPGSRVTQIQAAEDRFENGGGI